MVVRFVKPFALICACLQSLGVLGVPTVPRIPRAEPSADAITAQDADAIEQEAIRLGFSWPMMDLTSLTSNSFLSSIDEHDLSVVAFHTKSSPEWPLVRAVLKTVNVTVNPRIDLIVLESAPGDLLLIHPVFVIRQKQILQLSIQTTKSNGHLLIWTRILACQRFPT